MASQAAERMSELVEEIRIVEEIIEGGAREGDHCLTEREYRWHLLTERDQLTIQLKKEVNNG